VSGRLAHNKAVRHSKKGDGAMNTAGSSEVPVHNRLAIAEPALGACPVIKLHVAQIVAAVNAATSGSFVEVEIPE